MGAVLVTGCAQRIGRVIALRLARRGFDVAIHCHSSVKEAKTLSTEIQTLGVHAEIFKCDLGNEKQVSVLIKKVKKVFPYLSLLINSASVFEKSTLRLSKNLDWDKQFAINLKAPYILSRDFAKHCSKGQIINILDTNIVRNHTDFFIYLLTKKSLAELTTQSALELAPEIRVNGIAPGLILPPVYDKKNQSFMKRMSKNIPMKTKGDPEQIAQCIEFLLDSPFITGQILFNDGGEALL